MFGPRDSAYAVNLTYNRHTDIPTYIYISREISIEHPSVGLASLAQLVHNLHQLCDMLHGVLGDYNIVSGLHCATLEYWYGIF